MISIEAALENKFPAFSQQPTLIRKPTLSFLKKITREEDINHFLNTHKNLHGTSFIDKVFEHFDFSYSVKASDKRNIPAVGRVVIFANHPIGSLDGLAILRLVSEIRSDVRIVANDMLAHFNAINDLIIPLDNMAGSSPRRAYKKITEALENEEAIIIFPAGEVSRAKPTGVKDSRWLPGFMNFARRTNAPLLPIRIHAKNSLLFYGASMVFKPLGTVMLAREMFNKHSRSIHFSVGQTIPANSLKSKNLRDRTLVKRLKRHLYQLGTRRKNVSFETERTIAHPEDRQAIQDELKQAELLGETRDGNRIYLAKCESISPLLKEIGRLREVSFRKVGEGTGQASDLDQFDHDYHHLVLWDRENLEIAGAYRIGVGREILECRGEEGLYTRSLYNFHAEFLPYFSSGIELGRSFVNPSYWGKASLDYLWQGLGAYLAKHPDIRYLIGPISMSAEYPKSLIDTLVYFYQRYHTSLQPLARAYNPYELSPEKSSELANQFLNMNKDEAFEFMQQQFVAQGCKLPVLFKQYAALFEEGGFTSIEFSIDPDFGDCLDGLCMSDLTKLKPKKRKRYLGK